MFCHFCWFLCVTVALTEGTLILHPCVTDIQNTKQAYNGLNHYIPICHWHAPSIALGTLFCYCVSISSMRNLNLFGIFDGIRIGIVCWKPQQKLILCWLGVHIQRNPICFTTCFLHEKVSQVNPFLLEWEVTSNHTTSGHNLKSQRAGIVVHPMLMKRTCDSFSPLSAPSFTVVDWKPAKCPLVEVVYWLQHHIHFWQ